MSHSYTQVLVVDAGGWATKGALTSGSSSVTAVPYLHPAAQLFESKSAEVTDTTSAEASRRIYLDFFESIGAGAGGTVGGKTAPGGKVHDSVEKPFLQEGVAHVFLTESALFSQSAAEKARVVETVFAAHPGVQKISFGASPYCTLAGTGRTEVGLCIDSGWSSSRCTPVFGSCIVGDGENTVGAGGFQVASAVATASKLGVIESERLLRSLVSSEELRLYPHESAAGSNQLNLPDGTSIELESLSPSIPALAFANPDVAKCACDAIDACDPLARNIVRDLVKNIVLVGGNTVPAGFTDLFVARFSEHAPHHASKVEITIPPAAERGYAAWRGATAVASLLVNQADGWLDRQMVDELGAHAAVEAHARANLWAPWGNRAL